MMASLLHGFAENNIQENEMKEDIKSMTLPELTTWMSALGEKGFRAKQLYNWMHKNLVSSSHEIKSRKRNTFSVLSNGSPDPIKTTLEIRSPISF